MESSELLGILEQLERVMTEFAAGIEDEDYHLTWVRRSAGGSDTPGAR